MDCSLVQHQAGSLARWLECKQTIESTIAGSISMWLELALCLPPDHNRDMLNRGLEYWGLGITQRSKRRNVPAANQHGRTAACRADENECTNSGRERRWSESPRGTRRTIPSVRNLYPHRLQETSHCCCSTCHASHTLLSNHPQP